MRFLITFAVVCQIFFSVTPMMAINIVDIIKYEIFNYICSCMTKFYFFL